MFHYHQHTCCDSSTTASAISSVYIDFLQEIVINYLTTTNPLKTIFLRYPYYIIDTLKCQSV